MSGDFLVVRFHLYVFGRVTHQLYLSASLHSLMVTPYPQTQMNEEFTNEQLQLALDQLSKDIKAIGQRNYPRFGSGRLVSNNGSIHFTATPEMEVEQ